MKNIGLIIFRIISLIVIIVCLVIIGIWYMNNLKNSKVQNELLDFVSVSEENIILNDKITGTKIHENAQWYDDDNILRYYGNWMTVHTNFLNPDGGASFSVSLTVEDSNYSSGLSQKRYKKKIKYYRAK